MKSILQNALFLTLLEAMLSLAISAQSPPMYPDTTHPVQAPITGQDNAPQVMNQGTQENDLPVTVFRVNVTERTTKAVNYRNRGGSTEVSFRGTDLMPDVEGHAKVES
jgi:hypothetical protein